MKADKNSRARLPWAPLCISLSLLLSQPALAAEPAAPPVSAGVIERNLEEAGAPKAPAEEQRKALIEQLQVEQSAKGQGENQVPEGQTFVLNSIKVQGNTVLQNADIIAVVQPYIEKAANVQVLQRIASEITALYARQGYVTSRCVIPPQQAVGGVVTLKMEESRLGSIMLTGKNSYRYDPRLFTRYFHDLPGQVVNQNILNDRLRQLAKLPVTRVTPRLQASAAGITNLVLDITDRDDEFSVALDNQGGAFSGAERLSFSGNMSNFSGHGDPLAVRVLMTANDIKFLNSISVGYVRPVGEQAGRIHAQLERTEYLLDPEATGVSNLLYVGNSTGLTVGYEEPFLISSGNYWWRADLEHKQVQSDTVSNENNSFFKAGETIVEGKDQLSVLMLELRTDYSDQFFKNWAARNVASIKLRYGLEGFLGSMTQEDVDHKLENQLDPLAETYFGPIGNVENLDPGFTKLYLEYGRQQSLPANWVLLASATGEYSSSKKVPESYKFVGSGGGTNGYRASIGVTHTLGSPQLQASLSYNIAQARNYVNDDWLKNDTDTFIFTLGYTTKSWTAYYSVLSDPEDFDTVEKQHRFYLNRRW